MPSNTNMDELIANTIAERYNDNPSGPSKKPFNEEEFLKDLSSTPLFMETLPQDSDDNKALSALQALVYDGTPEEIAENFKTQGNECFQDGRPHYKNAIEYYTKGIAQKCSNVDLNSLLYSNRAAVNLELGNYRKVLNDCAESIKLNPGNVKAYFRSAKACFYLDKIPECLDCIQRGQTLEPKNKALAELFKHALNRQEYLKQQELKIQRREKSEIEAEKALAAAIAARGIKTEGAIVDAPHRVTLDVETQKLSWPVLLMYPEFKQTDLIASFHEDDSFVEHLQEVLSAPAPWDPNHTHSFDNVDLYFESDEMPAPKLVKFGKKVALRQIVGHSKFVVKNGVVNIVVVRKDGEFRKEWLGNYGVKL